MAIYVFNPNKRLLTTSSHSCFVARQAKRVREKIPQAQFKALDSIEASLLASYGFATRRPRVRCSGITPLALKIYFRPRLIKSVQIFS